jgi:hypothetical protein
MGRRRIYFKLIISDTAGNLNSAFLWREGKETSNWESLWEVDGLAREPVINWRLRFDLLNLRSGVEDLNLDEDKFIDSEKGKEIAK